MLVGGDGGGGGDRDIRMDTAKPYHGGGGGNGDIYMATARGGGLDDIRMETARGGYGGKLNMPGANNKTMTYRPPPLKEWERGLVDSPEVKRKATVAQLCEPYLCSLLLSFSLRRSMILIIAQIMIFKSDFLDYYFQTLGYLAGRKDRRAKFDADTKARKVGVRPVLSYLLSLFAILFPHTPSL